MQNDKTQIKKAAPEWAPLFILYIVLSFVPFQLSHNSEILLLSFQQSIAFKVCKNL
jgi:hypothetical protein